MDACSAVSNDIVELRYFECIFGNLLSAALGLGGILLFFMLIWGGFRYMSAGGDPKKLAEAQNTLTYAVGGLMLVALSFTILLLISQITGATNILDFTVFQ